MLQRASEPGSLKVGNSGGGKPGTWAELGPYEASSALEYSNYPNRQRSVASLSHDRSKHERCAAILAIDHCSYWLQPMDKYSVLN